MYLRCRLTLVLPADPLRQILQLQLEVGFPRILELLVYELSIVIALLGQNRLAFTCFA